jgi:hypothetical protein
MDSRFCRKDDKGVDEFFRSLLAYFSDNVADRVVMVKLALRHSCIATP